MKHHNTPARWALATLLAATLGSALAQGDPIRIIVPFPPGGGADAAARVIGKKLQGELGDLVIVENKPGAGGNIAADMVAQSAGDGKTLVLTTNSLVINPLIDPNVKFHPRNSFAPVAMIATSPLLIVVGEGKPYKSLKDLLDAARREPGRLSYASCGNGSIHHLAGEQLKRLTGVEMQHIPYRGCAPAMTDIAGGQLAAGVISLTTAGSFLAGNRARALALTSDLPSALVPSVPTAAKEGVSGYRFDGWYALFASNKTPKPLVAKLNAAVNRALADPEVKQQLAAGQMEPVAMSPEALGSFVDRELATYQPVVKTANIKAD